MQLHPKIVLELQDHFCINFNTNSYANPPEGLFLFQFLYKFIYKSIQKWLWSSRTISVPISIQIHMQIHRKRALELQDHFCINFNTNSYANPSQNGCVLDFIRIHYTTNEKTMISIENLTTTNEKTMISIENITKPLQTQ
jgi:hypothetical protein